MKVTGSLHATDTSTERRFCALLLGIGLLFYLFFAALDGAVIAVDSPSYISMEITREPLYPVLLAGFRMFFRAALPAAGEDAYLTAVAFFQSILMAFAAWSLTVYLRRELHLPKALTALLLAIPFAVSLLCRFAAARASMYSNSILTEGIAIPMYLIFFRYLFEFCRHRTKKSLIVCLVLSFLLYSTRKQMVIALAMLMLALVLTALWRSGRSLPRRLGAGLAAALLSAVIVLGGSTLFDMGYNYVVRGEAVRHSSDGRFLTTMVFYTAEREDADYIDDEEIRELFLEIYDECEARGYLGHSAEDGWLARVEHFGDHYDNIQIDTMWPAVNAYVSKKYSDGDEVTLNEAADEVMRIINVSVGPHNLEKIFAAFCDNVLSGLVTTVAQRRSILIAYSALIYLLYLVLWAGSVLCLRRGPEPGLRKEPEDPGASGAQPGPGQASCVRADAADSGICLLGALTLVSIACNVGLVSLVIFCQTRYTIYNMPLFYISLVLMLYEALANRRRGQK